MIINIISTTITILVLVCIFIYPHELGHFFAAKLCGVKPKQLAIGMGKTLWKKQNNGTLYSLKLLPIGGSIEIADDDENYNGLSIIKKCFILSAGAIMNIITAMVVVIIMILFFTPLIPTAQIGEMDVKAQEQGYMEGLQLRDEIVRVDGKKFIDINDITYYIALSGKESFDFTIDREGATEELENVRLQTRDVDGMKTPYLNCKFIGKERTLGNSAVYVFQQLGTYVKMVGASLKGLIVGTVPISSASSLVGIGIAVEKSLSQSFMVVLSIIALVSINLALVNLLPLPALDGGLIAILIIEKVTKRKINERFLRNVNRGFLIILMGIASIFIILDFVKIFRN